ncbi:MAG: glutamate--tRNA ligase [Flavobacterium sp. BFFFF2]|nr:MAG: glutamate--tRNA ligase [Flavobacterium sp. BFFFF2]
MKPVRVRFAPSPTGPLHIGGVRTALFNYLFAKKNKGTFYLRVEDTDQNRFVPGAETYILEALEWLGIAPDETVGKNEKFGPYRQSERKEMYAQYALKLIETGHAYYAFDSNESLETLRKTEEEQGKTFIYNWHNRSSLDTSLPLSKEETKKRIDSGEPYVIRFKNLENTVISFTDLIRGDLHVDSKVLDDKVLFKSDGMPTYHLANVVDDHLMETSHVIRGEEWLPSLPLHVQLYKAFGWEQPEFAHLPLLLKPIGNGKLSKRDGDKMGFPVFPLEWNDPFTNETSSGYREKGFFPEAVCNFLALLGWNDGTEQEIFTLEELVDKFDLSRIHKAGAKFDPEKNKWFNHIYLQNRSLNDLVDSFKKELDQKGIPAEGKPLSTIVSLIKERAHFVSEFWQLADYFFIAPKTYDEKGLKNWQEESAAHFETVINAIQEIAIFDADSIEKEIKSVLTTHEIALGKMMPLLRVALVGSLQGPNLFAIMACLGKDETINRMKTLLFHQKK